ncbi:MAG: hypothetical protein ABSC11_10470 [Smithella sp.]|jgi:hypothetical protein
MNNDIYHDICHEVARLRYDKNNLAERLVKRIKRKYKENIEKQIIEQIIHDVDLLYNYTAKKLPEFIVPSTTGYADPQFMKMDDLLEDIKKKFPKTDKVVMAHVARWVMYWEYLR